MSMSPGICVCWTRHSLLRLENVETHISLNTPPIECKDVSVIFRASNSILYSLSSNVRFLMDTHNMILMK